MTTATHKYKPATKTVRWTEKIGERKLLWGIINIPFVKTHKETIEDLVCKYCGEGKLSIQHRNFNTRGLK